MPKFKSIDALVSYIENSCHANVVEQIGDEGVDEVKQIVQEEVYDAYTPVEYKRYDEVFNSVRVTEIDNNHVTIELEDNGHWTSVKGKHMYAVAGLEMGKTWGEGSTPDNPVYRPQTNIEERSYEKMNEEAPNIYRKVMKKRGFKVK